jgi:hypothetical protein
VTPSEASSGPQEAAGEPLALFGTAGLTCARCEAFRCPWRNPRGTRYPCGHAEQIDLGHATGDHRWCLPGTGCAWAERWRGLLLAYAVENPDPAHPLLVVTLRTGRILPTSRHGSYRTAGPARTRIGRGTGDGSPKGWALVLCPAGGHLH